MALSPDATDGRSNRISLTATSRAMREAGINGLQPELERLARKIDQTAVDALVPMPASVRRILDEDRSRKR